MKVKPLFDRHFNKTKFEENSHEERYSDNKAIWHEKDDDKERKRTFERIG